MPIYFFLLSSLFCTNALAQTWHLSPDASLAAAIAQAKDGDTLQLAAGVYAVKQLRIGKSLRVIGANDGDTVLDAGGAGDVVRLSAPNIQLLHLRLQNGGMNLTKMNAGVFVEKNAAEVEIGFSQIFDTGFGIWVDGARAPYLHDNQIRGNAAYKSPDRGNGIHLWSVSGARIENNRIWHTRDGLYIEVSHGDNLIKNNELHHLRYGVHYMYSHRNRVINNRTHHTRVGYALMQSNHLEVRNNHSHDDLEYGILLNFLNYSDISGNRVERVGGGEAHRQGGKDGKAVFIFNALHNRIQHNDFSGSDMGIHLTAGSEHNRISANNFMHNRIQVKYVASRTQEWSENQRGNYWSDYLGWDQNADGIGDRAYEPNTQVDRLLWRYPQAKLLMHSPAVQILRWAQGQFPIFRAQGVQDSYPLMRPVSPSLSPSINQAAQP